MRSATAEMPIERGSDIGFSRGRVPIEQSLSLHDHAGKAITALSGLLVDERLLKFARLAIFHESGKRSDRSSDSRLGSSLTGSYRLAVDQNGARTTLRQSTSEFQAVHVQIVVEDEE